MLVEGTVVSTCTSNVSAVIARTSNEVPDAGSDALGYACVVLLLS